MRVQRGFSLIELLIAVAIILVIAAIAIPNLMRARIAANEAATVSALRTVTSAEIMYKITYPTVGYAKTIAALGPSATPTSSRAGLITADLADAPNTKSGYIFSLVGDDSTFQINATPAQPNVTGNRNFCTDTPVVLYWAASGAVCVSGTNPI